MLLSYLRTVILYLILIAVIRMMGKRQIGQMEPTEFVVTMLVANLASIPMQDGGIPLYTGLVPMLTILGVELVLSVLSLKSIRLRQLLRQARYPHRKRKDPPPKSAEDPDHIG